jgi:DNA-binding MarR family transcriptional regulator
MARRHPLPFDPIEEAARQWGTRWSGVEEMRAVTSLMRVQQLLLAELDELLRPHGLTFARYEALVLLSFTRSGALPLGKIGDRLQVHPTSVTSIIDRLERDGLARRIPHPDDRRGVLAEITEAGRTLISAATDDLVAARFGLRSLDGDALGTLTGLLTPVRRDAGDFADPVAVPDGGASNGTTDSR